jgi:23S rRNA pseudouridine1911/1915/1917 synthase
VNKRSGIPSHSLANSDESVEREIQAQDPHRDDATRSLQLLHRLDTGTSGVLLFGKGKSIFEQMRAKFADHTIRKIYWAWSEISPENETRIATLQLPLAITLPLAHHPKSKKRMIVLPEGVKREYRGKPLPAHTEILSATRDSFHGHSVFKFEVQIISGVMHQIRVHLQSQGFPLIGDPIYKAKTQTEIRLGLHARTVEFELNGFHYDLEADLI